MKLLGVKEIGAVLAVYVALGFGAFAHAQSIFQDFEGGTPMPATTFFTHPGSGGFFTASDNLDPEGIVGAGGFAGALGGSPGDAAASLGLSATGGVGGSQAAVLTLTNSPATVVAFGGVSQFIGFPINNPTDFIASVDVLAPAGALLSLRVESAFGPNNNGFALNFLGTGSYQTISGILGTDLIANPAGSFDVTDPNTSIIVASPITGNVPIGVDQEILVDNLSLRSIAVPEPSSLLILMGLGSGFATRRRRS